MSEYLKSLNDKRRSQHFLWDNRINVYNAQELPDNINIEAILDEISDMVPSHLLRGIESIMIGAFEHMRVKELDALYSDNAIYIYPDYVRDEKDLQDDIVHEVAHSLEEIYPADIYGDGQIEREFIIKRMQLYNALKHEEITLFPRDFFLNMEYSVEFDTYLYKTVGYPLLAALTTNMFVSPYGATSLREYFASGFEEYYMKSPEYVKKISPQIYRKIVKLETDMEEI